MQASSKFSVLWAGLTHINTTDPAQKRRGKLLLLYLALCITLLVQMTINNILIQVFAPTPENLAYLLQDVLAFIPFHIFWKLTQKGHIQLAAHLSFSLSILFTVAVSEVKFLEYLMVAFTLPIGISSFVLRPYSSFLYATLTSASYVFSTIYSGSVWDYDLTALIAIYAIALLTWVTAHQLEATLNENEALVKHLQASNKEINEAYEVTIEGWSRALEFRDRETEGHSLRVTDLTLRVARNMGFSEEQLIHVRRGALLHDMGKLGIPDEILRKPETLTENEMRIMRLHPQIAVDLLTPIEYLKSALAIPRYHHEKWDGSGYPHGLRGEYIPLEARIFAVIDVYDALSHDRPYRKAWNKEQVIDYLKSESGRHFDPSVVEVFIREIS